MADRAQDQDARTSTQDWIEQQRQQQIPARLANNPLRTVQQAEAAKRQDTSADIQAFYANFSHSNNPNAA